MKHTHAVIPRTAIALAVGLLISSAAYGQSAEGSIYGRAKPGEKITITSVENGASRQVAADAHGAFTAAKLPPGTYRVTAGNDTRDVAVNIGTGTNVSFEQAAATVIVSSSRSTIDVSSTESNTVFTADQMASLPVARNANAFALLAPGVVKGDSDLGAGGLPSFSGASVAENGYFINGFDVTNIRNFLSYANLPFDAIGSEQIKSGGYGAEFGRTLGGVVNMVTKRGTNTWKGGATLYWEPNSLRSNGKNVVDRDPDHPNSYTVFSSGYTRKDIEATAYLGGPIIKDKLFVFGLISGQDITTDSFGKTTSLRSSNTRPNGMVKLDFTPTDMHRLEFTGIDNKVDTELTDWDSTTDYATTHTGAGRVSHLKSGGDVLIGKYTGYLTDNLTVSALVGRVNDKVGTLTGARVANLTCPVVLDVDLTEIGCWQKPYPGPAIRDPNAPEDEDKRKAWRFDVDYNWGDHTFRGGIDNQKFTSVAAGESSYSGGYYYRYFVSSTGTVNGVPNAVPKGSQYVRRRESRTTSGEFGVINNAAYLEDQWKVTKNLLLSLGLRSESFDNRNGDGVSFIKKKNLLAPRIGTSWDVNGDSSLKIYGNLGRYYIPVAANTNIRSTRGELFEQRFYTFTSRDPVTQAPVGMGAQIGTPQVTGDGSLANPATIADTGLKPMNQDEIILGFEKALANKWTVGVKATYRQINDGMDDYCSHLGFEKWAADKGFTNFDSSLMAQCIMVNPGRDVTLMIDTDGSGNLKQYTVPNSYLGLAEYKRRHAAIEFTLDRPWDGHWQLNGSYVWSRTTGTAEGYVNSVINQEDAGITQDFDFSSLTAGANGRLSNDRTHVFKAYGTYGITDELRVGFNGTVSSGRPTSCIGFVPATQWDYSDARNYTTASSFFCLNSAGKSELHDRGTAGDTPWTGQLDLNLAWMPKWGIKGKLTFQVDVYNVFNSQKVIEWNETRDYSAADLAAGKLNPNYQQPTSFQSPRKVRLTARYEF
ncbi:MAG: TonB-dependent receptor [Telluria sp.]